MSVRITVLLEDDVDAEFTAFCHERGFKKSTLAARLIREHLTYEGSSSAPTLGQHSRPVTKEQKSSPR
jgi:hypothetical protein